MELNPITQTQALKMIARLGFPNPNARFIEWYFEEEGGNHTPIVNFETLAIEIEDKGLVVEMAKVVGLHHTNRTKDAVMTSIHNVIKKHRLVREAV